MDVKKVARITAALSLRLTNHTLSLFVALSKHIACQNASADAWRAASDHPVQSRGLRLGVEAADTLNRSRIRSMDRNSADPCCLNQLIVRDHSVMFRLSPDRETHFECDEG